MRHNGIERQTLLATLIPILVMGVLLEGYFILTHFNNLDRSLLERSQLLAHQLASSSEYAVFSGNASLLKQNVDAVMAVQDVQSIVIMDALGKAILESGGSNKSSVASVATLNQAVFQDNDMLALYEPIVATQLDLDGLVAPASGVASQLGSVTMEISKNRLNKQKNEYLLFSFLFTLLVFAIAMILALRTARSITKPILHMHQIIRRIGEGDLEASISPQYTIHELKDLASGIAEMALQLLRDREMLESRIIEATDGLRLKKNEVEQANFEKERLNINLATALGELQAIMEANPDILYVYNTKNELIHWNASFENFFGLSPKVMLNRHAPEFIYQPDISLALKAIAEVYKLGTATVEVRLVRHDGVHIPYLCNGVVLKNSTGEIIGFTGTGRDVSDRKVAAEHIHHLAHYDILTDLPNRTLLSDRLHQAMVASKREHTHLALMFLDLDMFKYVNDNLGHDVGDLLLKEVAVRILECLRESDTAARIGGDEFVVLLPSVESAETAMAVAEKIRLTVDKPFVISGHNLRISFSIGVAVYPEHGTEEKILLKNADTAMYLAKHKGRNNVLLFSAF